MWACYKHLYKAPPQGSVTLEAIKVLKTVIAKGGFRAMFKGGDEFWNRAKPSVIQEQEGTVDRKKIFWDDVFVDEIRQSISACGVFLLIPIFNLGEWSSLLRWAPMLICSQRRYRYLGDGNVQRYGPERHPL